MALVIEDGSGVSGANSYITVTEARAFASARGTTLSSTDGDVEILIMKSMDYFESFRARFKGAKSDDDNPLQWPRYNVVIDNDWIDSDEIPTEVKNAICQLVMDSNTSDIDPNGDGREVTKTRVDVLETEYNPVGRTTVRPILNKSYKWILPLLRNSSLGFKMVRE